MRPLDSYPPPPEWQPKPGWDKTPRKVISEAFAEAWITLVPPIAAVVAIFFLAMEFLR